VSPPRALLLQGVTLVTSLGRWTGLNPIISTYSEADNTTFARDKFGTQKGISSDMYFGRNDYDPHVVNEAQTRLESFQGASSISSNQYFGREDEEDDLAGQRNTEGLLGDGSLAGLESAARDAYTRILANPDVQSMGDSIRSGALKVCAYSRSWAYLTGSFSHLAVI
jgi:ADP-ribosylation factor GTPase-activating protein 2/3